MLQGEEILSQRSQESEDDDDDEEQRSALLQEESGDEVLSFPGFIDSIVLTNDTSPSRSDRILLFVFICNDNRLLYFDTGN